MTANPANEKLIRDFITAWTRRDADELAGYFTEDGVYHNMPVGPVAGRGKVRDFISAFLADWTETEWDILNLMSSGSVVIAERLDRTKTKKGPVDLPCCGVFEIEGGKIKVWRDYFHMGTYVKALS